MFVFGIASNARAFTIIHEATLYDQRPNELLNSNVKYAADTSQKLQNLIVYEQVHLKIAGNQHPPFTNRSADASIRGGFEE